MSRLSVQVRSSAPVFNLIDMSNSFGWYYHIFKNGKYLDLWSVNHTLSGVVIAGPLYYFSIPVIYSFWISLILMVSWEIYEIIFKITETWQNRTTDILTGVLGFCSVWYLYAFVTTHTQILIYVMGLCLFIILEVWGYIAYRAGVQ